MKPGASKIELLYTPLEEAAAELRRRREDKALCSAVTQFQKDRPPVFMGTEPHLALARAVFTADDELECLLKMAQSVLLSPLCLELTRDRFVSINPDKHSLCKLTFRIGNQERKLRIIDFQKYDGKPFSEIQTLSGQSLIEFHHCLIRHAYPGCKFTFADFSDWLLSFGGEHFNYLPYLALFITQGILLENFLYGDELERKFTEERVIPAFAKITNIFGVKPLIVRAYNADEELDPKHWQYAESLYPFAKQLLEDSDLCLQ